MRTVQRVYIPKGVVSLHYRSSYYFAPNNNTSRYTAHSLFPPLSSSGPPLELELITRTGVPISSSKMRSLEMNPPAQITAKIFQSSCRRFGAMLEPPNLACWLEMMSPSDSTHGLWCISPNGGLTAHSHGVAMLVMCAFVCVCGYVCVCVCVCVWGINLSCFLPAFSIFLCTLLWCSTFFYPLSTFSHYRILCCKIVNVENTFFSSTKIKCGSTNTIQTCYG